MLLNELYDASIAGYHAPEDDNSIPNGKKPKWKESRKTRLTLRQIRKLRKMNDVRNFEVKENIKKVKRQYKAPASDAGGPTL